MRHKTTPEFWERFERLPLRTRNLARRNFEILKTNPRHPSLQFKQIGRYRSVRIGLRYRVLGVDISEGILWFWIGTHAEYDQLVG